LATAAGLCFASLARIPAVDPLSLDHERPVGAEADLGRVSRAGVFALAESLDHVGPMCRSALDSALVLGVIAGADPDDRPRRRSRCPTMQDRSTPA